MAVRPLLRYRLDTEPRAAVVDFGARRIWLLAMWPGQQPPGGEQNPQQPEPVPAAGVPAAESVPAARVRATAARSGAEPVPAAGTDSSPAMGSSRDRGGATPPCPALRPVRRGGKKPNTTLVAIVAAIAVVAAAVITGILVLNDDDKEHTDGQPTRRSRPRPSPDKARQEEAGQRVRLQGPLQAAGRGLADRHQPQARTRPSTCRRTTTGRSPATGTITGSRTTSRQAAGGHVRAGVLQAGLVRQDAARPRRPVGTKGAQGSKNTEEAAEIAASNFVLGGLRPEAEGHPKKSGAKPYKNKQGIKGHIATASVTGAPKEDKCSRPTAKSSPSPG